MIQLVYPLSRVWRYRGGRDGHETLQQFMNFLGREQVTESRTPPSSNETETEKNGAKEEREKDGSTSSDAQGHSPNPYAGVVVFCVPMATEVGREVDVNLFQVWVCFETKVFIYFIINLIN